MNTKTPECDKMVVIHEDSQKIGEFLDWLKEQGIHLCNPHTHNEYCYRYGDIELKEGEYKSRDYMGQAKYVGEKELNCGSRNGEMFYIREDFEKLLARYFNIDLDKVEKEKQAILAEIRGGK